MTVNPIPSLELEEIAVFRQWSEGGYFFRFMPNWIAAITTMSSVRVSNVFTAVTPFILERS